jgi:serpin B
MPKFSRSYETRLNDVLSAMGMGSAFSDGADFSRFSSDYAAGDLCISEVKHKTFVEVNEEGTEAAAATSVGMVNTSAPQPIVIDRPFLLAIRERHSGTILFLGRIVDPE